MTAWSSTWLRMLPMSSCSRSIDRPRRRTVQCDCCTVQWWAALTCHFWLSRFRSSQNKFFTYVH